MPRMIIFNIFPQVVVRGNMPGLAEGLHVTRKMGIRGGVWVGWLSIICLNSDPLITKGSGTRHRERQALSVYSLSYCVRFLFATTVSLRFGVIRPRICMEKSTDILLCARHTFYARSHSTMEFESVGKPHSASSQETLFYSSRDYLEVPDRVKGDCGIEDLPKTVPRTSVTRRNSGPAQAIC